jgi:hypothetical protein
MDHSLTEEALAELTALDDPPCMSLYMPTHRHAPDNQQDPIRFRNLVKDLEASLRQRYPAKDTQSLLAAFESHGQDREFWNHSLDGLAVLGSRKGFRVFRLQQAVPALAMVASSFHTKPLRRFLQSIDRYQVLGLSKNRAQLFEGNRNTLDAIDPAPGFPADIVDALGAELTEPHQTVSSYGGVGGGRGPMRHGHGSKKDEVDVDTARFFRAVDRAVLEQHSKSSGLPLVLAALPEHQSVFRRVSHNPFLLTAGLDTNPDSLTLDELRQRVWEVVEPHYSARQDAMTEAFAAARAHGLGSDDLEQVAKAAVAGRVATLLIEADREIPGRLDAATGHIGAAALSDPEVDDVLDDIGELVATMGGVVRVIEAERMPVRSGLAATYRY